MMKQLGGALTSFYDATPSGVNINKFSSDLGIADNELRNNFVFILNYLCMNIISIIFICFINPVVLLLAVILL